MARVTVTVDTDEPEVAKTTWDGETTSQLLLKATEERRYTLSVGYPADLADAAVARDGHRDFASAEEIEKAAWAYLESAREVGLRHANGTEGAGRVVESYIWPGDDWDANGQVVKKGDWLIGIVWDEPAWQDIKKGLINGTSMQGRASRRNPSPADMARVLSKRG